MDESSDRPMTPHQQKLLTLLKLIADPAYEQGLVEQAEAFYTKKEALVQQSFIRPYTPSQRTTGLVATLCFMLPQLYAVLAL